MPLGTGGVALPRTHVPTIFEFHCRSDLGVSALNTPPGGFELFAETAPGNPRRDESDAELRSSSAKILALSKQRERLNQVNADYQMPGMSRYLVLRV